MKTVIEMAREAGIDAEQDTLCRYEGWVEPLTRFAELVRADAIAAEREACAELCVKLAVGGGFAADCATAIRARSNT